MSYSILQMAAQSAATPKTNPGMETGFPDLSFLHQQDWYSQPEVVLIQVKYVDPSALNCKLSVVYRVTHLLANMGWVGLDFGCSTLCLVLPGLMGYWQNWLSSWARCLNIPNQSQPNPDLPGDVSPCSSLIYRQISAQCS